MTKDSGGFVKSKPKGTVNFPPFESLDEHSLQETKRYQIYPRGKIQEYCRHIPYNSGKKDFYEKTGRESFEGQHLLQGGPSSLQIPYPLDARLTKYTQCSSTFSKYRETRASTRSCGITM